MHSEIDHPDDYRSLIAQISLAVIDLNKEDLPEMAKMHGLCEALAEAADPDAKCPNSSILKYARFMAQMLEKLILGEVDDPNATIALIAETVTDLADTETSSLLPPSDTIEDCEPSDDQLAAKLAPIFQAESTNPEMVTTESEQQVVEQEAVISPQQEKPFTETTVEIPEECESAVDEQPTTSLEPVYESIPLRISIKEMEFVSGFIEEANEHIEAIEAVLLEVERNPNDAECIDALFRPFHTIKGAAGFLNLRDIVSLTHEAETLLDQSRKGQRSVTPGLIDLIFEVVDILKVQLASINAYLANPTDQDIPQPPIEIMIAGLRDVVAGRIEPVESQTADGSPDNKIGENLVEQGAVPQEAVDFAVTKQLLDPSSKKIGESLIDMGIATTKQVSQALRPQVKKLTAGGASSTSEHSVRIDTAKLDVLVDMVGELVIAQTQVGANPQVAADSKLTKDVIHATKIVRDIQDVAMGMRMIPIGPIFQKMARLVRDVSRKCGKNVQLTISGEDTELDKNVIQQISDPLVHMVRNAVDHGLESAEVRRAAGKPEAGQVHLAASHQGGNIVIEISDDGKGLDPKALIEKGIEVGIVEPGESLSDNQAYKLIFAAGFSTAVEVTGISGRGVGMDVVRRNIEQLRGKVEIASQLGRGSTFSICLPLTLAIIDGMVLRVGTERFIIQTITVEQALRPKPEQITTVQHRGAVLNVRGRLIPLVQLAPLFNLGDPVNPCEAIVVIGQYAGGEIGLVVEELIGQQQVVIKSLGERFKGLRGISGAAILGDGRVGLILEMSGIADAHNQDGINHDWSEFANVEKSTHRDPATNDQGVEDEALVKDPKSLLPV